MLVMILGGMSLNMTSVEAQGVPVDTTSTPEGYWWGPITPLPDSLVEEWGDGRFSIDIVRPAEGREYGDLIRAAERLYPDSTAFRLPDSTAVPARRLAALRAAAELPGPRWWTTEHDGVLLLPHSIVGAATAENAERLRAFSRTPAAVEVPEGARAPSGRLVYRVRVSHLAEGDASVEVVQTLQLAVFLDCGWPCGTDWEFERRIGFSEDGRALYVRGDGMGRGKTSEEGR